MAPGGPRAVGRAVNSFLGKCAPGAGGSRCPQFTLSVSQSVSQSIKRQVLPPTPILPTIDRDRPRE